jgi:putative salt-induced outer membrane protein YdiY
MMLRTVVIAATMLGTSGTARADWSAKGEIGTSFASGNSENESANAALEVKYLRQVGPHPGVGG